MAGTRYYWKEYVQQQGCFFLTRTIRLFIYPTPNQFEYPFDLMQILALATLKLSILLFYRRIFVTQTFQIYNSILIGVVVIWSITFLVCLLAQCGSNIGTNFGTLGDLKSKCTDTFAILIGLAASDVAVDLIILGIPMPLVLCTFTSRDGLGLITRGHTGHITALAIEEKAWDCHCFSDWNVVSRPGCVRCIYLR